MILGSSAMEGSVSPVLTVCQLRPGIGWGPVVGAMPPVRGAASVP
jgi:hypothetical protein